MYADFYRDQDFEDLPKLGLNLPSIFPGTNE